MSKKFNIPATVTARQIIVAINDWAGKKTVERDQKRWLWEYLTALYEVKD